jgi:hypothetical protein
MVSFQQMLSDMNPMNYTLNGEPATFYGMIAVTTLVLGYVTVMESANATEKKFDLLESIIPKKTSDEPSSTLIPGPSLMPIPVDTEPVVAVPIPDSPPREERIEKTIPENESEKEEKQEEKEAKMEEEKQEKQEEKEAKIEEEKEAKMEEKEVKMEEKEAKMEEKETEKKPLGGKKRTKRRRSLRKKNTRKYKKKLH